MRWLWALSIVLIALVSCAIYIGFFWSGTESSGPPVYDSLRRSFGPIGPEEPPPVKGPGEMTGNPLAGVGMTPLKGDPDGIAPPRNAVRRSGFVRRSHKETEMMARYVWTGSTDRAMEYYKEYLVGKSMTFIGERTSTRRRPSTRPGSSRDVRPRRILVFHGPKGHVTITLREMTGNDGMLSISLNLVYPDS